MVGGDVGNAQLTFRRLQPDSLVYASLVHTYSTEYLPVFTQADGDNGVANLATFYGALAVTLHAVGEMPADRNEFTAGLRPDETTKILAKFRIE